MCSKKRSNRLRLKRFMLCSLEGLCDEAGTSQKVCPCLQALEVEVWARETKHCR